jgi:hypothetical protein
MNLSFDYIRVPVHNGPYLKLVSMSHGNNGIRCMFEKSTPLSTLLFFNFNFI